MKLKDGISLICVNAILKLKLGILIDVYAAGGSSDGRYRSYRRRTLHRFALSLAAPNDGSRFDDGRIPASISIGNNRREVAY